MPRNVTRVDADAQRLVHPGEMIQSHDRAAAQVQRIVQLDAQGAERAAIDRRRHAAEHAIAQPQLPAGKAPPGGRLTVRMGPGDGRRACRGGRRLERAAAKLAVAGAELR